MSKLSRAISIRATIIGSSLREEIRRKQAPLSERIFNFTTTAREVAKLNVPKHVVQNAIAKLLKRGKFEKAIKLVNHYKMKKELLEIGERMFELEVERTKNYPSKGTDFYINIFEIIVRQINLTNEDALKFARAAARVLVKHGLIQASKYFDKELGLTYN